ncbi:MAG: nucleotide exchange factor GrpE [Ignavibacteriaceae bacterium]|jgi:molecular chaperone GrpE|nr:nucleotide exchange factor GrpE [Ignavibacteriaceae bacterium]MCU0364165.1 nucleotide exchange factor GrpE [Ignavibacteriaceae bacterium]MCU0405805.1 nucleotide exchange factor GrpE [Ignavibacteriaceae bacterium]MCU0412967.1 nucleotide exchange factor GrpE [Ignavibacteriaceae bacterium]
MSKHKKDKHQEEQNIDQEAVQSEDKIQEDKSELNHLELAELKIADLEKQVKEWNDKFLRKAAEFENYKRRTENDQLNLISYAAESFIIKLLPIVDDFERSMEHIDDIDNNKSVKDGIKMVYEKLLKLLNEQGVKKMLAKGEPFNVAYHDALMQRKDDSVPPHTVLEEVESGYLYRDKVIRHAKVIVSEESSLDNNQITKDDSPESSSENEK